MNTVSINWPAEILLADSIVTVDLLPETEIADRYSVLPTSWGAKTPFYGPWMGMGMGMGDVDDGDEERNELAGYAEERETAFTGERCKLCKALDVENIEISIGRLRLHMETRRRRQSLAAAD